MVFLRGGIIPKKNMPKLHEEGMKAILIRALEILKNKVETRPEERHGIGPT